MTEGGKKGLINKPRYVTRDDGNHRSCHKTSTSILEEGEREREREGESEDIMVVYC